MSKVVAFFPRKNQRDAISGPAKEATPWKPWLRFNRADAYLSVPKTAIYEFAATSSVDRPHPSLWIRSDAENVLSMYTHRWRKWTPRILRMPRTLRMARRRLLQVSIASTLYGFLSCSHIFASRSQSRIISVKPHDLMSYSRRYPQTAPIRSKHPIVTVNIAIA